MGLISNPLCDEEISVYREGDKTPIVLPISPEDSHTLTIEESKQLLQKYIGADDLVFDVGANRGNKAQLYLDCGSRVICFEPRPECLEILGKRFLDTTKITIESIALSSKEGIQDLFICVTQKAVSTMSKEYTEKSRFVDHNYKWPKTISVPTRTLDQMIAKYGAPKYCKIDVEGFEFEVLQGLSVHIPLLSFECNTDQLETTKKCLAHLQGLGYRDYNFAFAEKGYFLSPIWVTRFQLLEKIQTVMDTHDFASIWGLWGDIYAK